MLWRKFAFNTCIVQYLYCSVYYVIKNEAKTWDRRKDVTNDDILVYLSNKKFVGPALHGEYLQWTICYTINIGLSSISFLRGPCNILSSNLCQ